MEITWDLKAIQQYIDNCVEESTKLEYKGALALENTVGKKKEIAKDVSAMANAAGGVIIYGVSEYQEKEKRHLPAKIDPIDRTNVTREWLSQVITANIQPHIDSLQIFPITISSSSNQVVYVVEIPQSTTAHQVTADMDYRYYERINFEVVRMEDHRIRDVMNRTRTPDIDVFFSCIKIKGGYDEHIYELVGKITNRGIIAVNHYKLEFTFPDLDRIPKLWRATSPSSLNSEESKTQPLLNIEGHLAGLLIVEQEAMSYRISCRSSDLLFPSDSEHINRYITLTYCVNQSIYVNEENIPPLEWKLFADNMKPKLGKIPFDQLHNF